jgi:hypothetical protein
LKNPTLVKRRYNLSKPRIYKCLTQPVEYFKQRVAEKLKFTLNKDDIVIFKEDKSKDIDHNILADYLKLTSTPYEHKNNLNNRSEKIKSISKGGMTLIRDEYEETDIAQFKVSNEYLFDYYRKKFK